MKNLTGKITIGKKYWFTPPSQYFQHTLPPFKERTLHTWSILGNHHILHYQPNGSKKNTSTSSKKSKWYPSHFRKDHISNISPYIEEEALSFLNKEYHHQRNQSVIPLIEERITSQASLLILKKKHCHSWRRNIIIKEASSGKHHQEGIFIRQVLYILCLNLQTK